MIVPVNGTAIARAYTPVEAPTGAAEPAVTRTPRATEASGAPSTGGSLEALVRGVNTPQTDRGKIEAGKAEPGNAAAGKREPGKTGREKVDTDEALSEIQEFLKRQRSSSLSFSKDEDLNRMVVKVVDTANKKVIWQVPPEEILAMARRLKDIGEGGTGVLIDQET